MQIRIRVKTIRKQKSTVIAVVGHWADTPAERRNQRSWRIGFVISVPSNVAINSVPLMPRYSTNPFPTMLSIWWNIITAPCHKHQIKIIHIKITGVFLCIFIIFLTYSLDLFSLCKTEVSVQNFKKHPQVSVKKCCVRSCNVSVQ